ncbi:MAG: hypothetical protein IJO47_02170 [Clostridia bacterium]|nr:hypothetical protein [Clostridia bacterium]
MKQRMIFLILSLTTIFGLIFIYENRPDTITLTVNGESYIYTATDIVLVPAVTEHSFDFILGEDNVFDIPISATKLPKGTLLNGLDMFSFMVAHIDGKPTLYVRSDIPATVLLESADYILLDILHNGGNGEEMAYLMALKETSPIAGFDTLAFNLSVSDNIRPELEEKLTELGEKSHTDIIFTDDFDSLVNYSPEYFWRFREEYGKTCYVFLEFREYREDDIFITCNCVTGSLGSIDKGLLLEHTDSGWIVKDILYSGIS